MVYRFGAISVFFLTPNVLRKVIYLEVKCSPEVLLQVILKTCLEFQAVNCESMIYWLKQLQLKRWHHGNISEKLGMVTSHHALRRYATLSDVLLRHTPTGIQSVYTNMNPIHTSANTHTHTLNRIGLGSL